jgi:hypothetical protein
MPASLRAERHDATSRFVAERERRAHHVVADPPVLVVVLVGAAHTDGGDLDQHLARARLGQGPILDPHVADPVQHRGAVRPHRPTA